MRHMTRSLSHTNFGPEVGLKSASMEGLLGLRCSSQGVAHEHIRAHLPLVLLRHGLLALLLQHGLLAREVLDRQRLAR